MKRLLAGIVIGLVLGAFIGYQLIPTTDIADYETTIETLETELANTQTTINELNTQITSLETEIDTTESTITELNNRITQLESQLDTYKNLDNLTGGGLPLNPNITEPVKVVYQLQNYDLDALADAEADLYIIDYSWEGDEETGFTSTELDTIRSTSDTKILSYMSIGEAEDYRWYWNTDWETNPPSWLGETNPEWEGNYKVRYWQQEWQNIVYDYLDTILEAGFDGVYLDIIDAYEYWGPEGDAGTDRATAEQEMVDFVIAISEHSKSTNPDFQIYPQNGEQLGTHPEYLTAIDGIGREDVWYNDNTPQNDTETTLNYLELFHETGKQVIVIDYPTNPVLIAEFKQKAMEQGYSWYPGNRELDTISEYID